MIHGRKRESLLSWVQSAGGHDVQDLQQLANGKLLSQLVVTLSDKGCDLSGKDESEAEKTDSVKTSQDLIGEKDQHEPSKETVDSSVKEFDSNRKDQEVINGFHDSSSDELDSNGVTSPLELSKTEDPHITSKNGVITESNDLALSHEIIVISQGEEEEEDTSYVNSGDVAVNGSEKENSLDPLPQDCSRNTSKVTNIISHETSSSLKNNDHAVFIIPADSTISPIQGNYDVVRKFIENMLELDCRTLVDFSQCMEGHEIELAKLTVLLLSAMVQYSLSTKRDHIMASCYSLSADAQEEIMDCLELFLKERQSPVERKEFHSRLARCAKLRISPRTQVNAVSTPHSNKPAKRGRKRKAYSAMEEFFDKGFESPIQNLIKSPDIRHTTPNSEARLLDAVRCKDKTIALLTYDLDVEKYNVDDLKKQNEDLTFQLSKLKKEKDKLKKDLDDVQTNLESIELSFEKAQENWKTEVKSYRNQIKDLKESEKFLKKQFETEDIPTNQKSGCNCGEEISSLKCAMQAKDDKIKECQKEIEIQDVQLEQLRQEKEYLESKLEENINSDNKPSCSQPSIQEKCFNISDLSLRNELKVKCEELQNHLRVKEVKYSVEIQKLEELLLQKDKIEKEWKARFRKTDKEREDAINRQKKLEIENSNLMGQIEVFNKVLPDVSHLSPSAGPHSTPANRRSSRNRNVCDSEKIGHLWHTYEEETSSSRVEEIVANSNAVVTGLEPDKSCGESSTALLPQSGNKSLNKKISKKSPMSKLRRSRSASNVTTSELGDSITTCKMCSQSDFCEVLPLIQNLCKIVREDNILDTDVLLELHKYERDFNMNDLVHVLTLLSRILQEERTSNCALTKCLKRKRDSNVFASKSDNNSPEKVKMSDSDELEQHNRRSCVDNAVSEENSPKNKAIDVHKYQQLLKVEKKKVACLQSKLKNLKNLQCAKEEEIGNLQAQLARAIELRDINVERCKKMSSTNELIRNELHATKQKLLTEKPSQIIQNILKTPSPTPPPPPPCENCPKLNEKLISYRMDIKDSERVINSLKDDLKLQKKDNEKLKLDICKLFKQKNELEEKLSDPRIVSAGVYSPSLKTLREKFSESRYTDVKSVSDGSQEIEYHNVSSITNYSFTVPSVDGFAHSGRNQSQLRAFCKAEDEAEMLSQSSIFEIQSETPSKRLNEINRRNTLCLPHLKSQYPLELNTTPSQHKYFQPPSAPSCSRNMPTSDRESVHLAKKRKVSNPSTDRVRSSFASLIYNSRPSTSGSRIHHSSTPKVKKSFTQSMHKTNTSAARLQFRRSKGSMEK